MTSKVIHFQKLFFEKAGNFQTVSDQLQKKTEAKFPLKLMKNYRMACFLRKCYQQSYCWDEKNFSCVMCTQAKEREKSGKQFPLFTGSDKKN